jgi:hypothetical protein
MVPLRIGIWFDVSHCAYGGPTVVLLNTILGFLLCEDVVILLNEPGDVNWDVGRTPSLQNRGISFVRGPVAPSATEEYKGTSHIVVATEWVRQFLKHTKKTEAAQVSVWPAGVDTVYYSPKQQPQQQKTQDFFIYYKSQKHADLHTIHSMLFKRFFHLRGHVLAYYCYTPEMLRSAALASRFCIVLNSTETQGLAMLEIMACDCPLFVVDCTVYRGETCLMEGASSAPCWSPVCGKKSRWDSLEADFTAFLTELPTYRPRSFVESGYSLPVAAASLRTLLSGNG